MVVCDRHPDMLEALCIQRGVFPDMFDLVRYFATPQFLAIIMFVASLHLRHYQDSYIHQPEDGEID